MIARLAFLVASVVGMAAIATPNRDEYSPSVVWNASASAPIGLYRVAAADGFEVGALVIVRPPEPLAKFLSERGYLPLGVPLLKRVEALPGQTICRNGALITVDGIARAPARERDRMGRSLPHWQGCRVVADHEVFLMNWDVPDSFDGRYFGPLPASAVVGRAVPLFTFPGEL